MGSAASSSQTLESDNTQSNPPIQEQTLDSNPKSPNQSPPDQPKNDSKTEESKENNDDEEEEEEEEGECAFCVYMKGGGCKETFVAWENCIKSAEQEENSDIAEKCFQVTSPLKKCMEAHSDYYQPILRAEKVAEAEAVKELESQKNGGAGEKDAVIEVVAGVVEKDDKSEKKQES